MKLLIICTLLFSVSAIAVSNVDNHCNEFSQTLEKFKVEGTNKFLLKDKSDYEQLKKAILEVPYNQKQIDEYLAILKDGPFTQEEAKSVAPFAAGCSMTSFLAGDAVISFLDKNKVDKALVDDGVELLKKHFLAYKNNPDVLVLILQADNALRLAEVKYGDKSPEYKNLEKLKKDMREVNKKIRSKQKKYEDKDENLKKLSEKELKEFKLITKQHVELSSKFFKKYSDLISKL